LSQINFAHQRYSNTFSFGTGRLGSKGLWDQVIGVSKSRSLVNLTAKVTGLSVPQQISVVSRVQFLNEKLL